MSTDDSDTEVSATEFGRIGREMIERAIVRAAGQESDYCVGSRPSRRYYISNLTPERVKDDSDELFTETTPSTVGLQIQPEADELEIGVAFEIYLRLLPTYEEYVDETPEDFDPTTDKFYAKEKITFRGRLDCSADTETEAERLTRDLNTQLADAVASIEENRVVHPVEPLGDVEDLVDGGSQKACSAPAFITVERRWLRRTVLLDRPFEALT